MPCTAVAESKNIISITKHKYFIGFSFSEIKHDFSAQS